MPWVLVSDMEMSGKNSGKKPPLCTGELDTISPPHLGERRKCE